VPQWVSRWDLRWAQRSVIKWSRCSSDKVSAQQCSPSGTRSHSLSEQDSAEQMARPLELQMVIPWDPTMETQTDLRTEWTEILLAPSWDLPTEKGLALNLAPSMEIESVRPMEVQSVLWALPLDPSTALSLGMRWESLLVRRWAIQCRMAEPQMDSLSVRHWDLRNALWKGSWSGTQTATRWALQSVRRRVTSLDQAEDAELETLRGMALDPWCPPIGMLASD